MLMAAILVNIREREVLTWHDIPLGSCYKDHQRVELTFRRGFGHPLEPDFLCEAILTELNSKDNLPQLTFRSLGQRVFNNFCNLSRLIFENEFFPLKRAFLGEIPETH